MMEITAKNVELAIWRSGLVAPKTRPYFVECAAKSVSRAARKLDRQRLNMCNGVMQPDGYMGWSEADQTKADETIEKCRQVITSELKGILVRGLTYDFRSDPRAAVLRVVNKENTRDIWIG